MPGAAIELPTHGQRRPRGGATAGRVAPLHAVGTPNSRCMDNRANWAGEGTTVVLISGYDHAGEGPKGKDGVAIKRATSTGRDQFQDGTDEMVPGPGWHEAHACLFRGQRDIARHCCASASMWWRDDAGGPASRSRGALYRSSLHEIGECVNRWWTTWSVVGPRSCRLVRQNRGPSLLWVPDRQRLRAMRQPARRAPDRVERGPHVVSHAADQGAGHRAGAQTSVPAARLVR